MQHPGLINSMLKNISDPKLRETYGAILSGKFPYKVYCLAPQKNPLTKKLFHKQAILIGYIDRKGRTITEDTLGPDGEPIAGIFTSRDRFDGRKGFRCHCGNYSIVSKEEQGIVTPGRMPTQKDLMDINEKVIASKKEAPQFINHMTEYDGFRIEEVIE